MCVWGLAGCWGGNAEWSYKNIVEWTEHLQRSSCKLNEWVPTLYANHVLLVLNIALQTVFACFPLLVLLLLGRHPHRHFPFPRGRAFTCLLVTADVSRSKPDLGGGCWLIFENKNYNFKRFFFVSCLCWLDKNAICMRYHKFCVYASSSSLHSLLCAKIERVHITISNPSSCSQTKNPLHGVINEHKILMLFIINKEFGKFIQKLGGQLYW